MDLYTGIKGLIHYTHNFHACTIEFSCINSLRPGDAYVHWWAGSPLVKAMTSQIAMIQRSASVHPAHGNERASAGAPPAFRPRVRYELDRSKPRRLPSRVTLAHRRRNWLTSALKAGRLPARVPPAWRQRPLTMENVSALSRESRDSNASLVTAVTAWRVGVC